MLKKLILIALACSSYLSAVSWQDQWAEGLKAVEQERFEDAQIHFDIAVSDPESDVDIYVDRAELLNRIRLHQQAEAELTFAIDSGKLSRDAEWKAYAERCMARASLGDERSMDDLRLFGKHSPLVPKKVEGVKKIIVKSAPGFSCYDKAMTCFYIHTGKCNSKHDIQKSESGDWIIHKACDCGCKPKVEKRICDACGMDLSCGSKESEAACKKWCTIAALGASDWCSTKLGGNTYCRLGCLVAVYEMSDVCWWCCEGGNFHTKCVQPLKDIKNAISAACTAEIRDTWDD